MIEVKQITKKKDIKKFVNFQIKLYKGNKYYVPPLILDEINYLQKSKNSAFKDAEVALFLAYRDGQIVGRIAGFILNEFNEKVKEKRVRFSRFDSINDLEVATALFDAVEIWAKGYGMEIIHGPLGANDLDREGLLIEGFEEPQTFEEQYSYEYYVDLIEKNGFKKETDWLEYRIYLPEKFDERIERISKKVLERSHLKIAPMINKNKFIDKYKQGIFDILDEAYAKLYGVVPISEEVRREVVKQFKLLLDPRFITVVLNDKDEVVAFGLALPSLSDAVQKSGGKLLPFGIFRLLKAVKKPKNIDLGLIAVKPSYQLMGINSIVLNEIGHKIIDAKIPYVETNLQLEDNKEVQAQFEAFKKDQHKRRRSYIKHLV
ncbi:MAG: GCN5 family acetyltransferase [Spirochaetales bacterium]